MSTRENFPLVFKKIPNKKCLKNGRKEIKRRLITKNGHVNLEQTHIKSKSLKFTKDFANTLVQIRWRWVTFIVIFANVFFYLIFAGLWMLDAWLSGDFSKEENFCIEATRHFTGYLLLSIESITTTGYGYLYPTEHCTIAWIILTLNTIVMILLDGAFISVVILKICKPLKKDAKSIFSRNSVICLRNGKLCLVFRIDDYLNKHLISTEIKLFFIERKKLELHEMKINSSTMLLWPSDIVHEINKESPLWRLSASDFMNNSFEIIATVTGCSLVIDQYSTSQTSYTSEEILWGFRFKSCFEFNQKHYKINDDVYKIEPCDTPLCSANKLNEIKNQLEEING